MKKVAESKYYEDIDKFKSSHDFLSLEDLKAQFEAQQRNVMADIEEMANPDQPRNDPQVYN